MLRDLLCSRNRGAAFGLFLLVTRELSEAGEIIVLGPQWYCLTNTIATNEMAEVKTAWPRGDI